MKNKRRYKFLHLSFITKCAACVANNRKRCPLPHIFSIVSNHRQHCALKCHSKGATCVRTQFHVEGTHQLRGGAVTNTPKRAASPCAACNKRAIESHDALASQQISRGVSIGARNKRARLPSTRFTCTKHYQLRAQVHKPMQLTGGNGTVCEMNAIEDRSV